jgi:hypothetical protein
MFYLVVKSGAVTIGQAASVFNLHHRIRWLLGTDKVRLAVNVGYDKTECLMDRQQNIA